MQSNLAVVDIKLVSGYTANDEAIKNVKIDGLKTHLQNAETNGNRVTIIYKRVCMASVS